MKIGAYMPLTEGNLSRSISRMKALGGNCIMVYTDSPKSFARKPVDMQQILLAEQLKEELCFGETVIHGPYIINPSNPAKEKRDKAVAILIDEMHKTRDYNSKLLVFHPGSSLTNPAEEGIRLLAESINEVLEYSPEDVTLCVETMAGKGSEVCVNFHQIALLYSLVEQKDRLGVCFDTCHVHDSGYDLSAEGLEATLKQFDNLIGLDKVKVLHINGSLNGRFSAKDRHANIGTEQDKIGLDALKKICHHQAFKDVPKILETPWVGDINNYCREIQLLKEEMKIC